MGEDHDEVIRLRTELNQLRLETNKLNAGIETRITVKGLVWMGAFLSTVLLVAFGITKDTIHKQVMAAIKDDVIEKSREIATNAETATINAQTRAAAIVGKLQDISTRKTYVGHFSITRDTLTFYQVGSLFFSTNLVHFDWGDGPFSFDEVPKVELALSGWNYKNPIRHIYADSIRTNGFNLIVAIEDVDANRSPFGDLHLQWTAVGKSK